MSVSIPRPRCRSASKNKLRGIATALTFALAVGGNVSLGPARGGGAFADLRLSFGAPAEARCLYAGGIRTDIPDRYCLEAQRTNCVRAMLTDAQYTSCLGVTAKAVASGDLCTLNGKPRYDLSKQDCVEAKATGCVQRLLTPAQYRSCLDAQPAR